ncbi:hypothetical protein BgiMline_013500, partial [Biomphalaria glabrata]
MCPTATKSYDQAKDFVKGYHVVSRHFCLSESMTRLSANIIDGYTEHFQEVENSVLSYLTTSSLPA